MCRAADSTKRPPPPFSPRAERDVAWRVGGHQVISIGWDATDDFFGVVSRLVGVPPRGRYTRDEWTAPQAQ